MNRTSSIVDGMAALRFVGLCAGLRAGTANNLGKLAGFLNQQRIGFRPAEESAGGNHQPGHDVATLMPAS